MSDGQTSQRIEQVFAVVTNEFPGPLRKFYDRCLEQGFQPSDAIDLTRDLLMTMSGSLFTTGKPVDPSAEEWS